MQSTAFDGFTKALAASQSRREAIRATLRLITHLVRGNAASKIHGDHQKFGVFQEANSVSPNKQQCSPVTSQGVCLNDDKKISNGVAPKTNGCGAKGGRRFPDGFSNANWRQACDRHDLCWGDCSKDKLACDHELHQGMIESCNTAFPFYSGDPLRVHRSICYGFANAYLWGLTISKQAHKAWVDAQNESCQCCPPCSLGTVECGSSCCASNQVCCNERCLPQSRICCPPEQEACGNVCCSSGKLCCDGMCIDQLRSVAHCGGCNKVCSPPNIFCVNGTCSPCFYEGQVYCNGRCCMPGQTCENGKCVGCRTGDTMCVPPVGCCPPEYSCCVNTCCPPGTTCCKSSPPYDEWRECCPLDRICHPGGRCIRPK